MPSNKNTPKTNAGNPALADARSYLFIGWWLFWYWARTAVIGKVVPGILLILSAVELLGPWFHVVPDIEKLAPWAKVTVSGTLFLTAGILVYHHWRLEVRVQRHRMVLNSFMQLLETAIGKVSGNGPKRDPNKMIDEVLNALVYALEFERGGPPSLLAATIMLQSSPANPFRLLQQTSNGPFRSEIMVDGQFSTAAKVASEPQGVLLYVPSTTYIHGVKISLEQRRTAAGKVIEFQSARTIPNAFESLDDGENEKLVRSLLCVRIWPKGQMNTNAPCFVLCLSAKRPNELGELDFNATKVGASILSLLL
jgi:hypothetical protein